MDRLQLEQFKHTELGFSPLLITNNWQVAQINHHVDQEIGNIKSIDIHFETDEVFVLLEGNAVLITAQEGTESFRFSTEYLKKNVVYNVPKKCWHNIALDKMAKVLIVEDKDSHLGNYEIRQLSNKDTNTLTAQLNQTIKDKEWD